MAATLLMHLTHDASGYFDNVWLWVADHDLDSPLNAEAYHSAEGVPLNVQTQISVYAARGLLVESQGPTWFYGTSSEHAQLYQYQLNGASNVIFGHMQTETPYYQPNPSALEPYEPGAFSGDPDFSDCVDDNCRGAWALQVIGSTDVVIFSAGFYSFFQDNQLGCTSDESCQLALFETNYSKRLWIYNIFTKGASQVISPKGGLEPIPFDDTTRNGYTSEVAAWLGLAEEGGGMGVGPDPGKPEEGSPDDPEDSSPDDPEDGSPEDPEDGSPDDPEESSPDDPDDPDDDPDPEDTEDIDVYVDPTFWTNDATLSCIPPCVYVLPPITLPEETTISFPPSTTSLQVGWFTPFTYKGNDGVSTTTESYVSVIVTTVLTVPAVTTSLIPISNIHIVSGIEETLIYPQWSIVPPPFVITEDYEDGTTQALATRTVTPKPWPWQTVANQTDSTFMAPSITISHTTGTPPPPCMEGCGTRCDNEFCSEPCLSGCEGSDCMDDDNDDDDGTCVEAEDCSGPDCEEGGHCVGDHCIKGGDCTGPKCVTGGRCSGPLCKFGGSCFGPSCIYGGGCYGPLCVFGGGCGPVFCPPGHCFGPLCGTEEKKDDWYGVGNPNVPPKDSCTTSTVESCRTFCIAEPTSSCTSSCRDVIGCTATPTSWASTVTPAPMIFLDNAEDWPEDGEYDPEELQAAALGIIRYLSAQDLLADLPEPTPTTTEAPSEPTDDGDDDDEDDDDGEDDDPTTTISGIVVPIPTSDVDHPECFKNHDHDTFEWFDAKAKVDFMLWFCDMEEVLDRSDSSMLRYQDTGGLELSIERVGSGGSCSHKHKDMPLGKKCAEKFSDILLACDLPFDYRDYGGTVVEDGEYGCIRWWIGKTSMFDDAFGEGGLDPFDPFH